MQHEQDIRDAFLRQAGWCESLGSPLTALVCRLCADNLDSTTAVGRKILGWSGEADGLSDAVPLRLTGALHALVRAGHPVAAFYPPHPLTEKAAFWSVIADALITEEPHFLAYLASPPQTNEVMRSAVLMLGFLAIARQFPLPFQLYEIGASAGLNLFPDWFYYRWGQAEWGDPASPVRLLPDFDGDVTNLAATPVRTASRRGVDLNPVDISSKAARDRLLSYVWPDQAERLQRLDAALQIALADPPQLSRADAAQWIEDTVPVVGPAHSVRVIYHSITWQYFSEETKRRIEARLETAGAAATQNAPLAWLRFEQAGGGLASPELHLKTWPSGEDRLLARAHPHGAWIKWLAP